MDDQVASARTTQVSVDEVAALRQRLDRLLGEAATLATQVQALERAAGSVPTEDRSALPSSIERPRRPPALASQRAPTMANVEAAAGDASTAEPSAIGRRRLLLGGGAAAAAAAATTVAVAGSATPAAAANGNPLTLGVNTNTSTSETLLGANASDGGVGLRVTQSGTGAAVDGHHNGAGIGITASSVSGYGLLVSSDSGTGLASFASSGPAIYGQSDSGVAAWGYSAHGSGVLGQSDTSSAVRAESPDGIGVEATSTNATAVKATSTNGVAVHAEGEAGGVEGQGQTGPGVFGSATLDVGVRGTSTTYAGVAGSGPVGVSATSEAINLLLVSKGTRPSPLTEAAGPYVTGSIVLDGQGNLWCCVKSGATGAKAGWRRLAGTSTAGSLHLLPSPVRVYDSRPGSTPAVGSKTKLTTSARTLAVTANSSGVPLGASAVLATLLLVNASSAGGNLTIWAAGTSKPQANAMVWGGSAGRFASTATTRISPDRKVNVAASAATDLVLDIVGYYL